MFEVLLIVHNALRWVVVGAGVAAFALALRGFVGGREFGKTERLAGIAFLASLHSQVLLGFVLYLQSPTVGAALASMSQAMKTKSLRYWAVEHVFGMIVAAVFVTVGHVRAKRAVGDRTRFKAAALGFGFGLLVLLASIPWPFLGEIGRPWLRLGGT